MTSRLVALLAVVLLAAPVAQARRKHHRKPLLGHVHRSHARAPKAWTVVPAVATPAPTPVPTPPPAGQPAPTPTATATSSLPPANPRSVSVNSTEYAFTLSQRSVLAGDVRIQFDNSRAQDPHSLSMTGPDFFAFDEQAPGIVTQRTVTLQPGTYVLFCPILDHEARGMKATLTVR